MTFPGVRTLLGWLSALGVSLLVLVPPPLAAQPRDERAVRAAYVFNLTKYVEWPAEKNELLIGFEGNRVTGEFLQKMLDGKSSDSKPIRVVLFPSEEDLKKCSLLYVGDSTAKSIHAVLDRVGTRGLLTVGEEESFTQAGGMVGLVKVGDQIQIQVNLEATQRAGIKISSRLLNLAVIVRPAPGARN